MKSTSVMYIVYTALTGRQGLPSLDRQEDWLKFRIEFFKKYTMKSLLGQSERNFLHWVSFRENTEKESLTRKLREYFENIPNYDFVFTFGFQYPHKKYQTEKFKKEIPGRLQKSLDGVKKFWKGQSAVYLTFLDSDDLFHKDAIKEIQSHEFVYKGALVFDKGYVYNATLKRLAQWNPNTCPPFSTILFPAEVFFDAKSHLEYRPGYISHIRVPEMFNIVKLSDRKYMVGCHEMQTSLTSHWRHPHRGPEYLDEKEKRNILKDFGISYGH